MPDNLVEALRSIVGDTHVLVDPDLRAPYETDWTGRFHGIARAVVRPADTAEVAAVLRACHRWGAAVVPQGGNTGLVGGSVPRGGEIVLSLRRLDRVEPVDAIVGQVIVGSGATPASVRDAARSTGWDIGIDLASRDSATVGGMVSTNAGGTHALRYGPMSDQVIGVEAVRSDGATLGHLPALRKDNTGYHLPLVLAGSEGTLAVITAVHLRLVPLLPARVVTLLAVPDLGAAVRVGGRLRRALPSLLALEGFLADGLELVCKHTGLAPPFDTTYPAYVLAECAGPAGTDDGLLAAMSSAVRGDTDVLDDAVAADAPGVARLWAYREGHTEAVNATGVPHKLDVTVPTDRLGAFTDEVRFRVRERDPSARLVLFGHVADGNVHVNVLGTAPDDESVDDIVLRLVLELGGSISAEHGIGIAKRRWLALARTPDEIATMRALRRAFDPDGILNPGVLFT